MQIVNKSGLPEVIFEFLKQDFYDREAVGDSFSATEMNKSIREIILTRRHWKELEVDAADRIWSLFGSGVHAVLEKLTGEDIRPIERLYASILGRTISGKYDLIKGNTLTDYKVTSAWTLVFDSRNHEWRKQLSIYRWLYKKTYGTILDQTGTVVAILRDWDRRRLAGTNYPQIPIVEVKIQLYSLPATERYLEKKVAAILKAEKLSDNDLPLCTDEERWWNKKTQSFQKCGKYCHASEFCNQYKESIA